MKKALRFSFFFPLFIPAIEAEATKAALSRLRQAIILVLLILSTFSCQQDDSQSINPVLEDPDWIRLEVPNGREAYAIAGDIDKTLLVTTSTKAYYTTDQGKTWQESKDFQGPVLGLLVRNDTTFSLQASGQDQTGQSYASLAQYFTTDYGQSWQHCAQHYTTYAGYQFYSQLSQLLGTVQAPGGIIYEIKQNLAPVSAGSNSFYHNPSELYKQDSFGNQTVRFPFQHKLLNLHLDTRNRLYVAASGGTFTKDNNLYCCEDNTPAILYVSKKPLP